MSRIPPEIYYYWRVIALNIKPIKILRSNFLSPANVNCWKDSPSIMIKPNDYVFIKKFAMNTGNKIICNIFIFYHNKNNYDFGIKLPACWKFKKNYSVHISNLYIIKLPKALNIQNFPVFGLARIQTLPTLIKSLPC